MKNVKPIYVLWAALIALFPLLLQTDGIIQNLGFSNFAGNGWVRIGATAMLYVLLAVGLNMIVGYAGLLDLGFVAFYAVGAYLFGLLASPHLLLFFPAIKESFPEGLHMPWWAVIPLAALLAAVFGIILGTPVLKLRGDYLAIVTLGFGEIIRIFMNNLDKLQADPETAVGRVILAIAPGLKEPWNITNGPKGLIGIDPITVFGYPLNRSVEIGGFQVASVTLYYYFFIALVILAIFLSNRIEKSRIGRAWMAIREDQIAAQAMGINTRNLKLMAFALGASLGGVSGVLFASFQGFISPESFSLMESTMIVAMVVLGGMGHLPGVVIGAVFLAALPEVLRYVSGWLGLQQLTDGRIDDAILRQFLIAMSMILIMMFRPKGLWPAPEHGKSLEKKGA